jgi:hypothetical protein
MFTKLLNHVIETYNAKIYWVASARHVVLRTDKVSLAFMLLDPTDMSDVTIHLVLIDDYNDGHCNSEWSIYDEMWFDSDEGPICRPCTYDDYVAFIKEYFEMRI